MEQHKQLIDIQSFHILYHVACMGDKRGEYRILVGRPDGQTALGRLRHRWKDNNKMDLQEVGLAGMDWIDLMQDRDRRL